LGARDQAIASLNAERIAKTEAERSLEVTLKAQAVVQKVAQLTQENLRFHVTGPATMMLRAVFPDDPCELDMAFELKRGGSEVRFQIVRKVGKREMRVDPLSADGGGLADLAALALRIVVWSLRSPRTRPTFVLDQPFKNLDIAHQPAAAQALDELSRRLGIQFLVVTHEAGILDSAEGARVFEVVKRNDRSIVGGKE
jgi:ABC-type Mn2+/Zn2+ transport system ATPase subunit